MAQDLLIDFPPDDDRRAVIAECIETYDVGSPQDEWPNNLISTKAVVYASGRIARAGQSVRHAVDPAELALCRRLAAAAAGVMADAPVGMGSEDENFFRPFYVAANKGDAPTARITEQLIRDLFGGTIFPPATITVEPLAESGAWWREVMADYEDEDDDEERAQVLRPWRELIAWFRNTPEFRDTAFVRIGDYTALHELEPDQLPPGTEIVGCVLPRLAIGLTAAGSVAGVFGHTVQT